MVTVSLSKITPKKILDILNNIKIRTLPRVFRSKVLAAIKNNALIPLVKQNGVLAPETEKILGKVEERRLKLSGALALAQDFPAFRVICEKDFPEPRSLISGLKDFMAMLDSQKSLATLMTYYLIFHPEIGNGWQWINAANAAVLYDSDLKWQSFFNKVYDKPAELIAAIPQGASQSVATLMTYYLIFHPEIDNGRQWIDAANAAVLYDSDLKWQSFFNKVYDKPAELIAAIPQGAKQSIATLMHYYLTFHPEIKSSREWINTANAAVLYESSPSWQTFFDVEYEKPAELIAAIPQGANQSVATLMTYYLIFHPEIGNGRQWINAANAVILALKYPFFIRANSTADLQIIHQELGLVLRTLKTYKKEFNKIDIDLRSFYRLNPALRWWRENPEARERAVEALKQGDSDLNQYPEIAQAIKRTKVSSKTFENYVVILKRYLEEEIVFWDD